MSGARNMDNTWAPPDSETASAARADTHAQETLVSEIDPASIPLPDPIGIHSLPAELLEHIGAYIREREWGPYPRNRTKSERKTAKLIWPLISPRNKNQLSVRWVCSYTLRLYKPRLRVRIASYERLKEWAWAQGLEDFASCVR